MPRIPRRALAGTLTIAVAGGASAAGLAAAASAASVHHRAARPLDPRVVAHHRVPATTLVKRTGRGRVLSRRTAEVETVVVHLRGRARS